MKKILIATNLLLLSTVLFFGFGKKERVRIIREPAADGLMADTGLYQASDFPEKKIGLINYNLAREMSRLYNKDLGKARIKGTKVRDATSIWFSLEMLRQFVDKVDNSFRGVTCKPKLGVRIYYAEYPDQNQWDIYPGLSDLTAGLTANRHTVFFVPTYRDTAHKMDVDFNVDYIGSNPCKPIPYYKNPKSTKDSSVILGFPAKHEFIYQVTGAVMPYITNHGGLSPPPENGIFPTPNADPAH